MPLSPRNDDPRSGAWRLGRSRWLALLPPVLALLCALALWLALDPARLMRLIGEGGFIERPTELLYFALAAAVWFWRESGDDLLAWAALSVVFAAFGAREMDLHNAWTHDSMLKVSFYLRREAPLPHKLVSAAVVFAVAAAALLLLRRGARATWQALRRREVLATTVAVFLVAMVVSKVFDRAINILADDYQVATSLTVKALVSAVEELLELSLPFVAGIGLLQHRRGRAPAARA